MNTVQTGNAELDGQATRGWLVGHFINEGQLRHDENVEIKWGTHKAGEARTDWVTSEVRTTIAILISGEFEMEFPDKTITLSKAGDYVMWSNGTDHKWRSTTDSTILTIRWPSLLKDQ